MSDSSSTPAATANPHARQDDVGVLDLASERVRCELSDNAPWKAARWSRGPFELPHHLEARRREIAELFDEYREREMVGPRWLVGSALAPGTCVFDGFRMSSAEDADDEPREAGNPWNRRGDVATAAGHVALSGDDSAVCCRGSNGTGVVWAMLTAGGDVVVQHRFRRSLVSRLVMIVVALLTVGLTTHLFFNAHARWGLPEDTALTILLAAMLLFMVGFACSLIFLTFQVLLVDNTGVTVRGLLRRRHLPWSTIQGVDAGPDTAITMVPFLVLTSGERVWLRCVGAFAIGWVPKRPARVLTTIQECLQDQRW